MPHTNVNGRKLFYEFHGEDSGVPLVLIMGLGGAHQGWLPFQIPDFASKHRVLIFDHRGVGESEDDGATFTTNDLAEDVVGLLDMLKIEKADFLGVFLGGMVAQEIASHHPARVRSLVLVSTFARPDAKRKVLLETWRDQAIAGTSTSIRHRERLLWALQEETFEQTDLIESMLHSLEHLSPPLSDELFARQCNACIEHDAFDALRKLRCETLVICGRKDALTPPKMHRELADEIPEARLVTMTYGGHVIMIENAQRFNQIVMDFLAESHEPAAKG